MSTTAVRWSCPGLLLLAGLMALVPDNLAATEESPRTDRNIPYDPAGGARTQLDLYRPASGEGLPVVVWIHGGGWRRGNKLLVNEKPGAFTEKGYLLASIDYRMVPDVDLKQQAGDVARAIAWVHEHAAEHGGDPNQIFLLGHSAGAHLAALVATDESYLESAGLHLADLAGVVLLDGAGYDVPRQVAAARLPAVRRIYLNAFTEDEALQQALSPVQHVARGKSIPPFLILHVAHRDDSRAQSEALGARLREAEVEARVVAAEGKTHMTLNRELGRPTDPPTEEVFRFLEAHRRQATPP